MARNILLLAVLLTTYACSDKSSEYESPLYEIDSLLIENSLAFDLAIDGPDNKWIATSKGLLKYNDGRKALFTRVNGLSSDTLYHVVTDLSDNVWCLGANHDVCQFNGSRFTIHRPSTIAIPKMMYPRALMVDSDNHVWVGAYLGLYEFDGSTWKNHYYHEAATNNWARKIFADPENEGSLIILTFDRTIIRFNGSTYQQLDQFCDMEPHLIECIAKDTNGTIYLGLSGKGLLIRTRNTNSLVPVGDNIIENTVYGITMGTNNRIWLATGRGLCYLENGKIFDYRYSLFGTGDVEEVAVDSKGKPWFSNYTGLVTLK